MRRELECLGIEVVLSSRVRSAALSGGPSRESSAMLPPQDSHQVPLCKRVRAVTGAERHPGKACEYRPHHSGRPCAPTIPMPLTRRTCRLWRRLRCKCGDAGRGIESCGARSRGTLCRGRRALRPEARIRVAAAHEYTGRLCQAARRIWDEVAVIQWVGRICKRKCVDSELRPGFSFSAAPKCKQWQGMDLRRH